MMHINQLINALEPIEHKLEQISKRMHDQRLATDRTTLESITWNDSGYFSDTQRKRAAQLLVDEYHLGNQ